MQNQTCQRPRSGGGFTLIELMVVMGIIALLIAITISVGTTMVKKGKSLQTENTIRTLEAALDAYIAETGAIPSPVIDYPEHVLDFEKGAIPFSEVHVMPVTDAVDAHNPNDINAERHLINSAALFIRQVSEVAAADELIKSIDPALLKSMHSFEPPEEDPGHGNIDEVLLPTPIDAWGNPIRYVHPALDGILDDGVRIADSPGAPTPIGVYFPSVSREFYLGEVRRNKIEEKEYEAIPIEHRDSDGGQCPSDRPYFYSAGPDGDPSTTEDNVYTVVPTFVKQSI